jgi:hypothetical protein
MTARSLISSLIPNLNAKKAPLGAKHLQSSWRLALIPACGMTA